MSSLELLAKLAPHGSVINGEGFGGKPTLTAIDVAGALGMGRLERPAYLLGMLKFAGEHSAVGPLTRIVLANVYVIGKANSWNLTDQQASILAALAIHETLHNPVCPKCNGAQIVAARTCDRCDGCGRDGIPHRKQAAWMGVPRETWRRVWAPRATLCRSVLNRWELDVSDHLRKHLGRLETAC